MRHRRAPGTEAGTPAALLRANARYWLTVLPQVRRELRRWEEVARGIPDPQLRRLALSKIADEGFSAEIAAILATLAPRRFRPRVTEAIVAMQVMAEYLDGLGEEPAPDPLANGRLLFSALAIAVTPEQTEPVDYYRTHPHRDDGGYLEALVMTCQRGFQHLPRADVVAPVARAAALRCGEAQTRAHSIDGLGTAQLSTWATAAAEGTGLRWWEYAAAGAASSLSVQALIAAAADPRTTLADARDLDITYLYIAAVSTLLDSVNDRRRDAEEGNHSFVAYYASDDAMAEGIATVTARAATQGQSIRNGGHHRMTAIGAAAYFLSAPDTRLQPGRSVKERVVDELRPLILPILGILRVWRLTKAIEIA